jgi:hypothetical protein
MITVTKRMRERARAARWMATMTGNCNCNSD